MIIDFSLGYEVPNYGPMKYSIWAQTVGQYRWYREGDIARVMYPLDYGWDDIYKRATHDVDVYFQSRVIHDVELFTNQFLATVPLAWEKFKTSLELISGTLDGSTIDPEVFEAGYERTVQSVNENSEEVDTESTNSVNAGGRTDTDVTTAKERGLQYQQGVLATEPTNQNIGELGIGAASGIGDNVRDNETTATIGSQVTKGESAGSSKGQSRAEFLETTKERRINYYDNLAFLRDRMVLIDTVKPFYEYFDGLFYSITSMRGNW